MFEASRKMYSPLQVGIAAFFGTPIAGSYLMALNFEKLGNKKAAIGYFVFGALVAVALFVVELLVPKFAAYSLISILSASLMLLLAKRNQETSFNQHIAAGGEKGSNLEAAGVGVAFLFVLFIVMMVVLFLLPQGNS